MAEIIAALAGPLAKIIENALSDNYDKNAELLAMEEMSRAVADARVRILLAKK